MTSEAKTQIPVATSLPPVRAQALWNLPNALTLLRIFLVPVLVVFLLTRYVWAGLAVFLAASITDWLDGYLARKRGEVTTLGQLLDPIADKLLMSAAFISLVELDMAPAWMVVVIIGRELAITGLRAVAAAERIIIPAATVGKYKLGAQVVAVSVLIVSSRITGFAQLGQISLWVMMLLAVISATQYFLQFWNQLNARPGD